VLNFFRIMPSDSDPSQRPDLACELTPEGIVAAAQNKPGEAPKVAFVPLPTGALTPTLNGANLAVPEAVEEALHQVLDEVSSRTRKATLVIPDAAVRVLMLDFDSLPEKPQEALPILRFRLKKLVPFDAEHAMVSYQVMARNPQEIRVLIAVTPNDVLGEYEGVLRRTGYDAGAVLPSTLAAVAAVSSLESFLLVNASGGSVTTAIASGEQLLLHRTIDLPEEEESALREMQKSVNVTMAYFEDTLHAPPTRLLCTGHKGVARLEEFMEFSEVELTDVVPVPSAGYSTSIPRGVLAGVTGALVR
jgi:type IV pilus assembly protein PilM